MQVMVELSLYPFVDDYVAEIQAFIDVLNTHDAITVATNQTSTHITGDYATVMTILGQEMQAVHEKVGQAIFVAKFLNFDAMTTRSASSESA